MEQIEKQDTECSKKTWTGSSLVRSCGGQKSAPETGEDRKNESASQGRLSTRWNKDEKITIR